MEHDKSPWSITFINLADKFMPQALTQNLSNWCQDFEEELYNASTESNEYLVKRIKYCREFCSRFPDSANGIIQNMLYAEADSLALLGYIKKAEPLFETIVEKFSKSIWGYVWWGDLYCHEEYGKIDYNKAENIYKKGITQCYEDTDVIYERLEMLEEKKEE